jgi:hypothetical protein
MARRLNTSTLNECKDQGVAAGVLNQVSRPLIPKMSEGIRMDQEVRITPKFSIEKDMCIEDMAKQLNKQK